MDPSCVCVCGSLEEPSVKFSNNIFYNIIHHFKLQVSGILKSVHLRKFKGKRLR